MEGDCWKPGGKSNSEQSFVAVLASVTKDPAFWETSTFLGASQNPAQKIKSPLSRQNKLVKHQTKCSSPVAGEMVWWVIKALVSRKHDDLSSDPQKLTKAECSITSVIPVLSRQDGRKRQTRDSPRSR